MEDFKKQLKVFRDEFNNLAKASIDNDDFGNEEIHKIRQYLEGLEDEVKWEEE